MEVVKFVSTKKYMECDIDDVFFCLQGRQEVVVECSNELKKELENLPSDYLQPRLKDIKNHLDKRGIPYVENYKGTTKV